jgi:hypothetical protein
MFSFLRLVGQPGPPLPPGEAVFMRSTDAEWVDLSAQLTDFDPAYPIVVTVSGDIKFRIGGNRYCDSTSTYTNYASGSGVSTPGRRYSRRDLLDAAWLETTSASDGSASVEFDGVRTTGGSISFSLAVTIQDDYVRHRFGELTYCQMGGFDPSALGGSAADWVLTAQTDGSGNSVTIWTKRSGSNNNRVVLAGTAYSVPTPPTTGTGAYIWTLTNATLGLVRTVYVDVIPGRFDIAVDPGVDNPALNDNVANSQYMRMWKNGSLKYGDWLCPSGTFNPTLASAIVIQNTPTQRVGGPPAPASFYDPATTRAVLDGVSADYEGWWPYGNPTPSEGYVLVKPDKPFAADLGPITNDVRSAAGYAGYVRWSWLDQRRGQPLISNGTNTAPSLGQNHWAMVDHCRVTQINWLPGKDYSSHKVARDNYCESGIGTVQLSGRGSQAVGNEGFQVGTAAAGDWWNGAVYDLEDNGKSHISCNVVIGMECFAGAHNDLYQWRLELANAPYYRDTTNVPPGSTIYMPRMYMNVSVKGEGRIITQDDIDNGTNFGGSVPDQAELGQSLADMQGFFLNANTRTDVYYLERQAANITSHTQFRTSDNPATWADGSFKCHNLATCEFGIARDAAAGSGYYAAGHFNWGTACGDPFVTWTGSFNSTMVVGYNVLNNASWDATGATNSHNRNFSCAGNVWPPTAMVAAYYDPAVGTDIADVQDIIAKLTPRPGSVLLDYDKPQGPLGDPDLINIGERTLYEPGVKSA